MEGKALTLFNIGIILLFKFQLMDTCNCFNDLFSSNNLIVKYCHLKKTQIQPQKLKIVILTLRLTMDRERLERVLKILINFKVSLRSINTAA